MFPQKKNPFFKNEKDLCTTLSKAAYTDRCNATLKSVGDPRSAITLVKAYEQTEWALIHTRRGEIDYGEHDRHGFVKSMVVKVQNMSFEGAEYSKIPFSITKINFVT